MGQTPTSRVSVSALRGSSITSCRMASISSSRWRGWSSVITRCRCRSACVSPPPRAVEARKPQRWLPSIQTHTTRQGQSGAVCERVSRVDRRAHCSGCTSGHDSCEYHGHGARGMLMTWSDPVEDAQIYDKSRLTAHGSASGQDFRSPWISHRPASTPPHAGTHLEARGSRYPLVDRCGNARPRLKRVKILTPPSY